MYYCNGCGTIRFMTRPENRDPPNGPMILLFCKFCDAETTYRVVSPEDFGAANYKGVESSLRNLYKKLTTPLSEQEEEPIELEFLDE